MDFSDLLKRASLNNLKDYLLCGCEGWEEPCDKTYSARLAEAEKNATAFFKARYSDIDEYDEIAGCFDRQTAAYRAVYFEIGLLLGAKIAFQIRGRMEEIA